MGLATLLAVAALSASCRPAPQPEGRRAQNAAVDAGELLGDLEALAQDAFEGRATGTLGGRLARAYLTDRIESSGLRPLQPAGYEQPFDLQRGGVSVEAANLIAVVPNRRLDQPVHDPHVCAHPLVVLTAHYDHLGRRGDEIFNGADDNASGVAAALGIARVETGADHSFHLVLALLDAEEAGLQGARALLGQWPEAMKRRIVANLNLDMIGRSDAGILWVAGAHHTPWLEQIVTKLEGYGGIRVRGGRDAPDDPPDWTNSSDHAAFHREGVPFLYFGVDDHSDYHLPTDDVEKLDLAFLSHASEVVRLALDGVGEHINASGQPKGN